MDEQIQSSDQTKHDNNFFDDEIGAVGGVSPDIESSTSKLVDTLQSSSEEWNIDMEGLHDALPDDLENVSQYKFSEFAANCFQGNATHTHIRQPIEKCLLPDIYESDETAGLTVWVTILRFMGDLQQPNIKTLLQEPTRLSIHKNTLSVIDKLYSELNQNSRQINSAEAHTQDMEADSSLSMKTDATKKRTMREKLVSFVLNRKSKNTEKVGHHIESRSSEQNELFENRPTTNLEKLHFIIGNGLLRPALRDEIYCQIAKQLTQNPSRASHARGWILLALCVRCFAPSDKLIKYLMNFIREGPPGYSPYCEEGIRRTLANGTRKQPPSWLELMATKSKKPLTLQITTMDGCTRTLLADSATTTHELCNQLSAKLELKDTFGFSIYIAEFDKVASLGSGCHHVMDAVSQCEQLAKQQGIDVSNAPWRIFFRKEIYTPWHEPCEDRIATDLIYTQVVRGITSGEYRCDKEDDLATIAAQQYYINYGSEISTERLMSLIPSYIPESLLAKSDSLKYWTKKIIDKLHGSYFIDSSLTDLKAKENIVSYSKYKWPLLFSRFFEAVKLSGPSLPKNDIIIAVSWTGLYVVDDTEAVLLELSFPEITALSSCRTGEIQTWVLTVNTVTGVEYVFNSPDTEVILDLVVTFIEGLKNMSKYVIALQDYSSQDVRSFLSFQKGDLIKLLQQTGKTLIQTQKGRGECVRTGRTGDFSAEYVHIIPAIILPPSEVLDMLKQSSVLKALKD